MRVIKFRAWDEEHKRMVQFSMRDLLTDLGSEYDFTEGVQVLLALFDGHLPASWPDLQVMQFTGLLDKNGKEIYEGDVINDGYGGNVVYIDRYAGFYIQNSHANALPLADAIYDKQIIGNIHENPELVK